jgi:hypothetical protein
MNNETLTYFEEEGYKVVSPARLFGRNAELHTGEAECDGGYREASIDEMFGTTTELGTGGDHVAYSASLTSAPLFQSVVLATLVVYLAIVIRSWSFIRSIWSDIFKTNNEERMVFEGGELPLQRFKLTAALLGMAVVALAVVRIAGDSIPSTSDIYSNTLYLYAPLGSMVLMLLFVVWNFAYHKIIGWILQNDSTAKLSHIGYTNFVRMVVVLYPFTAVWLLADRNDAFISTWTLIICGSVLLLLYLKDTFLFFSGKKISIFYWILYLCTAILLPWSLLTKLLAGQVTM